MSSCGILGLALGSMLSAKFVGKGRRPAAVWMSLLVIASSALQVVWLHVVPICIGRLLFGFAAGALITCANCMLKETVPDSQKVTFCVTVSFGMMLGLMICLIIGIPLCDLTREAKAVGDVMWRLPYASPILIGILTLILLFTSFDKAPLLFLIKQTGADSRKDTIKCIQQVYKVSDQEVEKAY